MTANKRLIALMTGASRLAVRRRVSPATPPTGLDPYAGALTAPDLTQLLREKGAL